MCSQIQKIVVNASCHIQDLKLIFNVVEKWDNVLSAFHYITILLIEKCKKQILQKYELIN